MRAIVSRRLILRVLCVAAATPWLATSGQSPASQSAAAEPSTVAVMYFNNSAMLHRADYEPLRKGIADVLITELHANPSLRIVERDHLQQLLQEQNLDTTSRVDQETAVRIGKLLGVQHMIMGGYQIDPTGNMRLDARAVNVESSQVVYGETVTGKSEDVLAIIADLAAKMNRGMKLPEMPRRQHPSSSGAANATRRFQAIMLYSRALAEEDSRNPRGAIQLYREFLQKCPEADAPDQRRIAEQRIRELEQR